MSIFHHTNLLKSLTLMLALGVSGNAFAGKHENEKKESSHKTAPVKSESVEDTLTPEEALKKAQETLQQQEEVVAEFKKLFDENQAQIKEINPKKTAAVQALKQLQATPFGKIAEGINAESIEGNVEKMQQRSKALEDHTVKTQADIALLNTLLQNRQVELKETQQEHAKLKTTLALIEKTQKTNEGPAFEQDVKQTQQQLQEKEAEVQQVEENLAQLQQRQGELKQHLSDAQQNIAASKKALQTATQQVNRAAQLKKQEEQRAKQAEAKKAKTPTQKEIPAPTETGEKTEKTASESHNELVLKPTTPVKEDSTPSTQANQPKSTEKKSAPKKKKVASKTPEDQQTS